jgi:hypothetical protein
MSRFALSCDPPLLTHSIQTIFPVSFPHRCSYKESWHRSVQIAGDGGPGRELGMYRSMLTSLERVRPHHAQVVHVQSKEDVGKQKVKSFDILFSVQFSVQDRYDVHGDFFERRRCRFRLVEFWGTPPEQISFGMHLKQQLVPYPNPWNQFVGSITMSDSVYENTALRPPRVPPFHVIVHGKDERYFHDGAKASLEQAARLIANRTVVTFQLTVARMEKEGPTASGIVSVIPDSRSCEPTGIIIASGRLDSIYTASDPSERHEYRSKN